MERSPASVVTAWCVAFNRHDYDELAGYYAEDAINHQVAEEPIRGKEVIRKSFEELFTAFPDIGFEVLALHVDGEWAIVEWTGWSTHKSQIDNPACSGKDGPRLHGSVFFRVLDGKIVHQRGYWDRLTWARQAGMPLDIE